MYKGRQVLLYSLKSVRKYSIQWILVCRYKSRDGNILNLTNIISGKWGRYANWGRYQQYKGMGKLYAV